MSAHHTHAAHSRPLRKGVAAAVGRLARDLQAVDDLDGGAVDVNFGACEETNGGPIQIILWLPAAAIDLFERDCP